LPHVVIVVEALVEGLRAIKKMMKSSNNEETKEEVGSHLCRWYVLLLLASGLGLIIAKDLDSLFIRRAVKVVSIKYTLGA
jgi:hypothetical protein